MRSADLSGVGAERFSAGKGATGKGRAGDAGPSGPIQALQLKLSPITTAVTLVALISATLFVIFDTVRTLDDARTDLAVIGRTLAEDIAEMAPGAALAMLQPALDRYEVSATATLEPAGTSTAPTLLSVAVPAGQHGVLSLRLNDGDALGGITQRGVGAFALAFLLIGLNWRQRQASEMPDAWQRRNYQTLAAAIPMGIACWTQSGRLIVCNQQYRDRLKLSSKSMTYHEAVKQLILGGYMKLINEDDSNRLLEVHREDGSCLLIDERPLADGGFMTLVSDVTEAKRTDTLLSAIREEQRLLARRYHEEKLRAEAASRSKTNFLAHLSHDIRTPLNHIIGFAELMRHQTYGPLGDERYGDYVQSIKASGEHLLASFATILDLAELESGQKILRTDPVPVDQLLAKAAERFCPQAKRAGVAIVLGDPCGAVLIADGLGMQRMVGNLLDNAIRFTPAGGRIALAAFAAEDGVVIEISDTGTGMSEERLQSLSHPFALGDATFTREGVGPGLGISISRAIAELSGGRLAIDSSPSLGTTVAISLPLPEAAAVRHAAE